MYQIKINYQNESKVIKVKAENHLHAIHIANKITKGKKLQQVRYEIVYVG